MSNPVRDPRWAGSFECAGPCRRKRLIAGDFSAKMVQRRQKDPAAPLTCKACVEARAEEERATAAAKRAAGGASAAAPPDIKCSKCGKAPPEVTFSRTQQQKAAAGKARCGACVAKAEGDERAGSDAKFEQVRSGVRVCPGGVWVRGHGGLSAHQRSLTPRPIPSLPFVPIPSTSPPTTLAPLQRLAEARAAREVAERSGDSAAVLKASAVEAALEGERVTGVKASGGGGRGRGRGWGRGRGSNPNSMLGRGRSGARK